jgi:hypothetical protein
MSSISSAVTFVRSVSGSAFGERFLLRTPRRNEPTKFVEGEVLHESRDRTGGQNE